MRIEGSEKIDRPIEAVFGFVGDPRNDPRWCPRVVWCEQREGSGPGPGARYEAFHRPSFQRPHPRWIEIVTFERPHRIVTTQRDAIADFTITYLLQSETRGTRLTQIDEIDWKLARPIQPIAIRIVRRHIGEQFATLKRLLEDDQRAAA
jgi:uncharacterized protein YndB with AHSA1/START domain